MTLDVLQSLRSDLDVVDWNERSGEVTAKLLRPVSLLRLRSLDESGIFVNELKDPDQQDVHSALNSGRDGELAAGSTIAFQVPSGKEVVARDLRALLATPGACECPPQAYLLWEENVLWNGQQPDAEICPKVVDERL